MMKVCSKNRILAALVGACCLAVGGCEKPTRTGTPVVEAQDTVVTHAVYPALAGTVGEVAILGTNQPVRVEGYGIVADLPHTGSGEMPANIRAILTELLYKAGAGSVREHTDDIDPRAILESDRIAVVEVRGLIPPLATAHSHFDLSVTALPGTQTTSLEGGILWTSELKVIGLDLTTDTRTIAIGRGPVYCTPAIPEVVSASGGVESDTKRNLRKGRVFSGGDIFEDMPVMLQTFAPSRRTPALIQRLVNTHFPHRPPTANAENESLISLTIPAEYQENPKDFIDLVSHMYLSMDVAGFIDAKAPELIRALHDPHAPHQEIGMALQALGRTIVEPYLRAEYTSPDPVVRFYTARAGAYLQDVQASIILEEFVKDSSSAFRIPAMEAIARVARRDGDTQRATVLFAGTLLNDRDNNIRLAAYNGLKIMRSPAVESYHMGRFDLDLVPSTGPNLIYATQGGRERIALIGGHFNLVPGALYISRDNLFTINVPEDAAAAAPTTSVVSPVVDAKGAAAAEPVLLYYRGPLGDKSISLKSPTNLAVALAKLGFVPDPRAPGYDSKKPFIGLPYQRVVETLSALCKDKAVEADFILGPPSDVSFSPTNLAEEARPEGPVLTPASAPATAPAETH